MPNKRLIRRERVSPCADFWHVLRFGLAIAVVLFVALPKILG